MNTKQEVMNRLREQISRGVSILGAGAGNGISAKSAEMGNADFIIVYNSGRFRMHGRGSLAGLMPYGDANAIVMELAEEVLPIVKNTPVIAGVCGTDPHRRMEIFLRQIRETGFVGVQNFPTVGLCDGIFRQHLEETGMGFKLEIDMIRKANEMGLLTIPYVFNTKEAISMAKVGADIIVAHMGLTTKGLVGAHTSKSIDDCVVQTQEIHDVAKNINPDVIVLCHGGPISEPEDAAYVIKNTRGISGFLGASSVERLPTELAISEQVKKFKQIRIE